MFKKLSLALLAGALTAAVPAQELFVNGNLDGKENIVISGWASGAGKASVFTEDKSWNRCLKIEVAKFDKSVNLYPYIGRTRNQDRKSVV